MVEAALGQGDDIHIALGDDDGADGARRLARGGEVVEVGPLVEQLGFRRIQVFGGVVAQGATAEGDDAAALVGDREHHPVAEIVEAFAAVFALLDQAGGNQLRLGQAAGQHGLLQRGEAAGGIAQAEAAHGIGAQRPLVEQVALGVRPGLGVELAGEPLRGRLEHVVERRRPLRARPFGRIGLGQLHAGLGGQRLDRFGKLQAVRAHDEADDVAMRAATEAVEEALVVVDGERRRFFVMERAQPGMFAPPADQPHLAADHRGQRQPLAQLVEKGRAERRQVRPVSCRATP